MTVMDNDDPADPSVHEPHVTGAPDEVWLVYGDLERDDTHANCCASGEVTWCEDAQFAADVRYVRADVAAERERAAVAAERERCAALCESIGDGYQAREAYRWAEMKTDAQTGAHDCAAAIRNLDTQVTGSGQ